MRSKPIRSPGNYFGSPGRAKFELLNFHADPILNFFQKQHNTRWQQAGAAGLLLRRGGGPAGLVEKEHAEPLPRMGGDQGQHPLGEAGEVLGCRAAPPAHG